MERDHLLYLDIQSYQASTTGVYEDRVSLVTFVPHLKKWNIKIIFRHIRWRQTQSKTKTRTEGQNLHCSYSNVTVILGSLMIYSERFLVVAVIMHGILINKIDNRRFLKLKQYHNIYKNMQAMLEAIPKVWQLTID